MIAEGSASLQLSAKSVGLFEAFYSSIKPVQLLLFQKELSGGGKIGPDAVDFEFEIPLQPVAGEKLHESYHGVFVNLQYVITVEVRRGMLAKNLKRSIEFIVEAPEPKAPKETPAPFSIVPESLENVRKSALHQVPSFKIKGQLDTTTCNIAQPLTGEVIIEECSATIRSIELQLVRVETCGYQDGMAREATEIQNIQIADGPVCHGWPIPVHMVFPRLFTCPTVSTRTFKVDFEVNLVVLFSDGHLLTENFPLKLVRAAPKATIAEAERAAEEARAERAARSGVVAKMESTPAIPAGLSTDSAAPAPAAASRPAWPAQSKPAAPTGGGSAAAADPLSSLLGEPDPAASPSAPPPAAAAAPPSAPMAAASAASDAPDDPLGDPLGIS